MKGLRGGTLILFLILVIIVAVGYISCLVYVKPNEFGIKQVRIGFKRGIRPKVYEAGYHFVLPLPFERLFKFPKDIQILELSDRPITKAGNIRHERAAHIQTSDGFFVDVDATILYRIVDPYKVFITLGPGRLFEDNGIVPRAEPILKQTLGELTTEEFYNSPLRVQKVQWAKRLLNEELNPRGIKVEQVLIRYFRYSEEIQKNIEEKKLKDQLAFKNQAEARAAAELAKLKKVIQEGKAAVDVKLEEGRAYMTRKRAEADLYMRKRRAEADLLVKLAEARKTALKNKALQGEGAELLVGLKMAEVFEGMKVIVLPSDGKDGLNPFNLEKTLKLMQLRP